MRGCIGGSPRVRGCARTRLRTRARINRAKSTGAKSTGVIFFLFPLLFSYRGCRGDFLFSFRFSLKPKRGLLITFPLLITLPRCSFRTSLSGVVVWGLGRSPNSKNLCASLRPLCGKT